jgi:methylated-DNA-protein-cysteine methyltransferase-like protein
VFESGASGAETLIVAACRVQTIWQTLRDKPKIVTPEQRAAAILKAVRGIRRGTFASYGEVARRAGLPGRARLVGTVLREAGDAASLPWHRVTGAGGRIAFPSGSAGAREQLRRLAREGIETRGGRVVQKLSSASPRTLDALLWKM